jgi:hypothetical protein
MSDLRTAWLTLLAQSELPFLGAWLRRRAARELAENLTPGRAAALAGVAAENPDHRAAAVALTALEHCAGQATFDALAGVWFETRHRGLAALLRRRHWSAHAPLPVALYSCLLIGRPLGPAQQRADALPILLAAARDADRALSTAAQRELTALRDPAAQAWLCHQAGVGRDDLAAQLSRSAGFVPADPVAAALYLFLTGQEEAYARCDFDHRYLQAAYAGADPELQARLRGMLRQSGQPELLSVALGDQPLERIGGLAAPELALLIDVFVSAGRWQDLWTIVPLVPLPLACRALAALQANPHFSPTGDDAAAFAELVRAAALPLLEEPAQMAGLLAPGLSCSTLRVGGRANALAFSPRAMHLAIGTGRGKVIEWDAAAAIITESYTGFDHAIGALTYTVDGRLIAAERTRGDDSCAAILCAPGGLQPLAHHAGSITALVPLANGHLLLAGRDRRLVLLDGAGRRIAEQEYAVWPRAVAAAPDARHVALLHRGVTIVDLPDLAVSASAGFSRSFTCLAYCLSDTELLLGDQQGRLWRGRPSLDRTWRRWREVAVDRGPGTGKPAARAPLRSIFPLPSDDFLLARSDGSLQFLSGPDLRLSSSLRVPGDAALCSAQLSPAGEYLATGDVAGCFTLWDLRLRMLPGWLVRPLAQASPALLQVLDLALAQPAADARLTNTLSLLRALVHFRFRYALTLAEPATFASGAFDISLA